MDVLVSRRGSKYGSVIRLMSMLARIYTNGPDVFWCVLHEDYMLARNGYCDSLTCRHV